MDEEKKLIIQKLATKYNMPLQTVSEIINFQFKFVNKVMSEGKFESIRLPYFGKFNVHKNRLKYIQEKSDKS